MSEYSIVAASDEKTVVSEYVSPYGQQHQYQSEEELENDLIRRLAGQGYEMLPVHSEKDLIANLRVQIERLNQYHFTEDEWKRFFKEVIAVKGEGIADKTRKLQGKDGCIFSLVRDTGETKNITILDRRHIHNNHLQVIHQYAEEDGMFDNRYDVTILVNGFPMVHIELKRRGVSIRQAFNQIKRYQRESFWAAHGLYEYVQIFVISNGTETKYYSNTTRDSHVKEMAGRRGMSQKTSNSFEFTSYWADGKNKRIGDLVDFASTFLSRHTLLAVLTKYCVFTANDLLLVMRPYQIAAAEAILSRITISTNYKKEGTLAAGGYIWHTTGSGKTLTSFKTAQLASRLPFIDKVLFVVDRRDLDYQTMKEYDRFEKGAANGNTSTRILKKQLEDPAASILVTTIQKLDCYIKSELAREKKGGEASPVRQMHTVLIFDECHRSQFGDMHKGIVKYFKKYHLFGFTGTPIFGRNSSNGTHPTMRTTEQIFGDRLHTYTIVDAINDHNVLPFRIDYVNTVRMKPGIKDKKVAAIDQQKALEAQGRIEEVVQYILEHFDQKTKHNVWYSRDGSRLNGFNSIFAVSSIPMAMRYYEEFQKQMKSSGKKLVIGTIFSYSPNAADPEDESFDTEHLDAPAKEFLDQVIKDYNARFKVNYEKDGDSFQNYYKDLSQKMKDRKIDILIVVDMFLTGFDATTLNTLWVDKNLRNHGLIQAFSRTNRILNSVKTYGNIVCFRDLQQETDDAIALFGDKDARSLVLLRTFDEYYEGYDDAKGHQKGYRELIDELADRFSLDHLAQGMTDKENKDFLRLFGQIKRMLNILDAFDDFQGKALLSDGEMQDYQSFYIDVWESIQPRNKGDKENIVGDIEFEAELVRQVEVNIDYILMLVEKYHKENCKDKEILTTIRRAIDSSLELRSKKELIMAFIDRVNAASDVQKDWKAYVQEKKKEELDAIIAEEKLQPDAARQFMKDSFRDGEMRVTGTGIDKVLPRVSLFGGVKGQVKERIIERLKTFFEKFFNLGD